MQFRTALMTATIMALPLTAHADPINGLYISGGAGINLMPKEDATVSVGGTSVTGKLSTDVGPVFVLGLGWGFGNGLRTELEGSYRSNKISGESGFGGEGGASGTEKKYGVMANILYDFNIAPWITPYIGAGVGYQFAHEPGSNATTGPVAVSVSGGTKGSFAYQAIAGAAFPVGSIPGLAVTAEYRFMGLAGSRTYTGAATVAGVGVFPLTDKSTDDYNHSFLIGIRYAFGAPAAAVVATAATPAPAAAMARSYLVFFDWDKATLTDRARGIIQDAASNSTKVAYTKIDVNGYTDTSGTPLYNKGLSMRRAQSVAAELVRDGVPKSAIAISAFGDTNLLVPTGAGVREPQNRRVEIIIH